MRSSPLGVHFTTTMGTLLLATVTARMAEASLRPVSGRRSDDDHLTMGSLTAHSAVPGISNSAIALAAAPLLRSSEIVTWHGSGSGHSAGDHGAPGTAGGSYAGGATFCRTADYESEGRASTSIRRCRFVSGALDGIATHHIRN